MRVGAIPLTAERLAADFGPGAERTRQGVRLLYEALCASPPSRSSPLPQAGEGSVPTARKTSRANKLSQAMRRLGRRLGVSAEGFQPDGLLLALERYYALVVRLLVGHLVEKLHASPSPGSPVLFGEDFLGWPTLASQRPFDHLIAGLTEGVRRYDISGWVTAATGGRDLLKMLYQALFPQQIRHGLGEYYTPDWLAEHVLDQAGYRGDPTARLLDPACGSGTFLVAAIQRIRARIEQSAAGRARRKSELCRQIIRNVVGFDVHPLAVLSARANYLFALGELAGYLDGAEIPVWQRDAILGAAGSGDRPFDYLVGNPPWIAWDDLSEAYREATKPLWQQYGLFTLSGSDARHGGAKKDLSILLLYATADRFLADGGRLAMVMPQTVFQTKGAGEGFRRFRLGQQGAPLRVLRVDDLVEVKPFAPAANWTSTVVMCKGTPTSYPVPYVRWRRKNASAFSQTAYEAGPIDPRQPMSPWVLRPRGLQEKIERWIGPSQYRAHLGANTGGANGVYWVNLLGAESQGVRIRNLLSGGRAAAGLKQVEDVIEPHLLYPLLRWSDVARYRAEPSAHLLLVQDVQLRRGMDPNVLRESYSQTYAYLKRFEEVLLRRAAYRRYQERGPFYSMYDVGRYTLAPIKVVWRRMDRQINAAVVDPWADPALGVRPVVPQETCVLIACDNLDEAHYLCALMNSVMVGFLVAAYSVRNSKAFGTPGMLEYLGLRRYDATDPRHRELAAFSRHAHQRARRGQTTLDIQQQIDELAARLWGATQDDLDIFRRELS